MSKRSAEKRAIAREQMQHLENAKIGTINPVSDQRVAFVLKNDYKRADELRTRPEQINFIRADKSGLLFRDATEKFSHSIPLHLWNRRKEGSTKGLEFNWGDLEDDDIRSLIDSVLLLS